MARTLKAKAPEAVKPSKPKVLIFGKPGVKKTLESMQMPSVYYFDHEGGATQPFYQETLKKNGGVYFGKEEGSQDFKTVIEEVETLATTKHKFLTAVFDSFSKLYNMAAAIGEAKFGSDYGRDKREAAKPTRQLQLWLERLDMNVFLICHEKAKWSRQGSQLVSDGFTFDGHEKLEYDLDLVLQVVRGKGEEPRAIVVKSRLEGFPLHAEFPWTAKEYLKRVGAHATEASKPFELATPEQAKEIKRLVEVTKDTEWQDQVLNKYGVDSWEKMESSKVAACIEILNKKLKGETK